MNILVTGGLGVNGAWITTRLARLGHRVVVFESRLDASLLPADVLDAVELVQGDVTDLAALTAVLQRARIQRVVHLAARITGLAQDLHGAFQVNIMGTTSVMEAAVRSGVERVVLTSSRAAYGHIAGRHAHPHYEPLREEDCARPSLPYDVAKHASEGIGMAYARYHKIGFVALRFSQIYGPGKTARHDAFGLLGKLVEQPHAGQPVAIPSGGEQRDDVIYVDDAAAGTVAALLHERPGYNVYNISRNIGTTLHDFAAAVRHHLPQARIDIGGGVDYQGFDVQYYSVMDNQRARDDLGFSPRHDLVSGVGDYLAWLDAHSHSPRA